jgi:hypothetical protein
MQHPSGATFDAFPASQAIGIFNIISQPGIQTNIYANRTIKRTNSTLDATFRFRDDMPGSQRSYMLGFVA